MPCLLFQLPSLLFFDLVEDNLRVNDESGAILIKGFKRMEDAVVTLRNDLVKKVDESMSYAEDKENSKLAALNTKLDNLESLLHENKSELKDVNVKLTEIAGKHTTVKLEQADVNALAIAVSDICLVQRN